MIPSIIQEGFCRYKNCKELIRQAVQIKFPDSEDTADEKMTNQMRVGLYYLLYSKDSKRQDWGREVHDFSDLLYNILMLLGRPDVISQLPEYRQKDASEKILKLANFFTAMEDDQEMFAAMDIELVNHHAEDDECYQETIDYYTYNKQALTDSSHRSYHFDEYVFQKKKLERMEQFLKSKNTKSCHHEKE